MCTIIHDEPIIVLINVAFGELQHKCQDTIKNIKLKVTFNNKNAQSYYY